ncbi:MAG: hypothetical protein L0Y66_23320 [Myxococcaceae bacterium]|nr:hypothetical protein [Myxococcaceae bacterium]
MSQTVTTGRSDNLGRLETFCLEIAGSRKRLVAQHVELDARVQEMERTEAESGERLGAFARVVGVAGREGVELALRASLTSLTAATVFVTEMAEARMTEGHRVLQRLETDLDEGVTEGKEGLLRVGERTREGLDEVEEGAAELTETAEAGDAETAARLDELNGRMDTMAAALANTGRELAGLLRDTDAYLASALAQYVAGVFAVFRSHLERDAQPYLVQSLDSTNVGVSRGFDDFMASLENVTGSLEDRTERQVDEGHDRVTDFLKNREKAEEDSIREAEEPLRNELAKAQAAVSEGAGVVSDLQPLVQPLAQAKHVVQEIDEMMNFSME